MLDIKFKLDNATKLSYTYLAKWTILALLAGVMGTLVVHSFVYLLGLIRTLIAAFGVPIWVWPVVGAILVGGIVYRIQPHSSGEGIPSFIRGVRDDKGKLGISETFYKYWAALLTIATFGNGGVVGPLGRVTSGIMSYVEGKINKLHIVFDKHDRRTGAICGLAATIGTIFHSSIGAGIFAVEIIQRKSMGYKDLFPSILSSACAVFVCKSIGLGSFYQFSPVDEFMDVRKIGWLLLLAILTGATGLFYTYLYAKVSRLFGKKEGNVLLKVVAGSVLAFFIAWAVNPELLGTSRNIIGALFTNDISPVTGRLSSLPVVPVIIVIMFLKMLCNCLTVGSGMSAGFTGPMVIVGMLLGVAVSRISNVDCLSPTYYAFLAAGFAGMLASAMNVPLAAAVMAIEVFGLQYSFPAGFAAILGFQVTRHRTIYEYTFEELDIKD
ncbi:chloride channel protein [candidate division KSB1 bacterium]|nr:chloride channel protein [candidate division KSB1 bacterium]